MKRLSILVAFVAALLTLMFTGSALAASVTVSEDATASSQETQVAFKEISLKGKVLVKDEHIRIQSHTQCKWYAHFTNSSTVIGEYHGGPFNINAVGYPDTHGYLCRDKFSPTGYVKMGGGRTKRKCGNIAAPPHVHMPFKIVKASQIIEANTKVKVYVTVHTIVKVHGSCGEASGEGSASDWIWMTFNQYSKTKGHARLTLAGKIVIQAQDKAAAEAHVHCSVSVEIPKTCQELGTCPPVCTTCECTNSCKPPVCTTCECEHSCKPPECTTCECTKTPEECHPKNGEPGAGEKSGGPGNGCDAGYVWNGSECVKTGNGQEGQPGGNSEGGYCINPETGLVQEMQSDEHRDQFEYCRAGAA